MSKSTLSTKLLHAIYRIELDLDDDKSVSILKGVHINLCALERENETLKAELDDHKYLIEEHERTIINHEKEIEHKSDLWLEACKKLSEFQKGIHIEKAKECGDYYCLDLGYCVATYFENGKWYYSDDGPNRNPCEVSNRLYPLPSTETQMEGE